jgi:hypothetical protein
MFFTHFNYLCCQLWENNRKNTICKINQRTTNKHYTIHGLATGQLLWGGMIQNIRGGGGVWKFSIVGV